MTLGFFAGPFPDLFGGALRTAAGAVPVGRVFVTVGSERLDQVAQEAYGFQLGAVEALLIANPGLADLGLELPAGLAVLLPELALPATVDEVQLFTGALERAPRGRDKVTRPQTYTAMGGERLDQVAHAIYGAQVGVVEALLYVNPGLADAGLELPVGTVIALPELVAQAPALGSTPTLSREAALWG